jgi:hypothetical protein
VKWRCYNTDGGLPEELLVAMEVDRRYRRSAINTFSCRLFCYIVVRYIMSLPVPEAIPGPSKQKRSGFGRLREVSMAPHAQRFPNEDEDKAMRITWYLVCGLSLAVVLAVLLYIFLQ